MTIAGLGIDASNQNPAILLRDPSGRRQVPVLVDHAQAHNIIAGLQQITLDYPQSHDLMLSLLKAGGLHLVKVIIHSLEKDNVRAVLKLGKHITTKNESSTNERKPLIEIEAHVSDAIALAIRSNCKIWMMEEVVLNSSIPIDLVADKEDQDAFNNFLQGLNPTALIKNFNKQKDSIDFHD